MNDTDPMELMRRAAARRAGAGPVPPATVASAVHDDPRVEDAHEEDVRDEDVDVADGSVLDDVEATGERRRRRKHSTTRNAVEWVLVLVGALVVAVVVKTWLFQAFYIPSGSMEPTLEVGDRVLVNKISYDIDDVERGHIIVFERPESWGAGEIKDLIKRVIALPGETVSVVSGQVFIDGAPLEEPWLEQGTSTPSFFRESGCVPQCTVPEGQVFVLGDNRSNSDASNHFGSLPFDQVVGRAFVRVWPIDDVGGI